MKKVLTVDDSPMVLNLLEIALSMEDYEVDQANNPKEAIEKVKENTYDFGIFDVNMPGMTGLELIPIVKSMENGKNMKIIMLTTESGDEMQKQAKQAGAKAWLIKPFKDDDLIQLMSALSK
ncbi:MAG: response regulator [Leptospiraceae bacterium]|nr:response regulator [Leptospiraceae bacterium]MCP5493690.1 response regulator [Leptospiraceae bacterium]